MNKIIQEKINWTEKDIDDSFKEVERIEISKGAWKTLKENIKKKSFKAGFKEPHNTEDGYCCACGYDIAGFEEREREAFKAGREEAIKEELNN